MGFPLNAEIYSSIKHGISDSFYGTILAEEQDYVYGKICKMIDQDDLVTTYTGWGGVPEPRQLSAGATGAGGGRQAKQLKDYKITGTVVEWEQTLEIPRSIIETQPGLAAEKAAELARAALVFMDRRFVGTILPASTAGYDGVALYADAHPESGTNQDNNVTSAAATGTNPTATELETEFDLEFGIMRRFTNDAGTPINAATRKYKVLTGVGLEEKYKAVAGPKNTAAALEGHDVSGGTGRFRGRMEVMGSPFVATDDRHYLFVDRPGYYPVALLRNKDFEVTDNINTASDTWNFAQTALIHSYARFEFIPWDWKGTIRQVWT